MKSQRTTFTCLRPNWTPATGGSLALACPDPLPDVWHYRDPLPNRSGNIQNIYDIFEQNYGTWDNARIQNQLAAQPDIVVLQFGENLASGTTAQLATALNDLLTGLKTSSNPHIFITSQIIGSNAAADAIKRQACAEDPSPPRVRKPKRPCRPFRRSWTPQ